MERALITPIEAAEMLGISRATLFRLMRRGDFPVIRVESCPRIPVRALHRWIDSQARELGLADPAEIG
jgi:excisionase family DNA binding protein